MNKKFFLSAAAAMAFTMLSACGDNVVESLGGESAEPIQTQAKLNVLVTDASNGKPISATVVLLSTNDTAVANAAGTAVFEKLSAGEYAVLVEANGYASIIDYAQIYGDQSENIYIANENTTLVSLYPLTSTLDGVVYYTDASGKNLPAVGAKVRVQLYGDFVDKIFEADVDANGKYVFTGLPAVGTNYQIWALEYTDAAGKTYGVQTLTKASLIAGSPAHITTAAKYEGAVSVFDLIGYKSVITDGDTVVFEFSDSIDVQKVSNGTIYVSATADLKVDGKLVKVIPVGKWNGNFYVEFYNLTSKNNKTFSNDYSITVLKVDLSNVAASAFNLKAIDSATINHDSYRVTLQWNKIPGATDYNVFVKKAGETNYKQAYLYNTTNDTTKMYYIDCVERYGDPCYSYNNINSNTYTFIIQAVNSQSKSQLNGAISVDVYDRVSPRLNSYSPNYYYSNYNLYDYGVSSPDSSYYLDFTYQLEYIYADSNVVRIYFSEPMDTTGVTVSAPSAVLPARLGAPSLKWYNESSLLISLKTIAGTALATNVAPIYFTINGLKDKKGNALLAHNTYDWLKLKLRVQAQYIERI
ncbi:hypothetical protein AGMMS49938_18290 [Fibrobacterales bacterium]|nr:hypothetical protein AGMMS49938_18290 [Fibrobacterales bacterium]